MSTRDAPAQGEPTGIDDTFPSHTPGVAIMSRAHSWRGHEPDGGCWYFSSLPAPANGIGGRFDLRFPRGTCYWASTELAAARERLGRSSRLVAHDEVDGASVSTASFDPGRLADLLAESAALFAVTQELASSGPYALSQQWATAFDAAGFEGMHYQPRFSTQRAEAVALFGPAGKPSTPDLPISSRTLADVLGEHGYTIISAASAADLSPLID